jgi:hypothetical protein
VTDPKVRESLSERLGVNVEVDPALGKSVHIRQPESDLDTIIVRVGPDARAGDVLAKAEQIAKLRQAAKLDEPAQPEKPVEVKGSEKGKRVDEPVDGVFESVSLSSRQKGWSFEDHVEPQDDGWIRVATKVNAPNGAAGSIARKYNPATGELTMSAAFFDKELPKWIQLGTPMAPGRGTPTFAYLQMRQMRKLGIGRSTLKKVKMSSILNVRTVVELHAKVRDGTPLNEAILETHSVQYAQTPLVQSGHRIRKATVSGGGKWNINTLLGLYEIDDPSLRAVHDAILSEHGVKRGDDVLSGFDIELELVPWTR